MKTISVPIDEAVGRPLSHDLTQISPESGFKGARFKRGHILLRSDLETLRAMGRERLTVLELDDDEVHEDDGALRLARRLQGDGLETRGPSEGKCTLVATEPGLLSLNPDSVNGINLNPRWILATKPNRSPVSPGETVAGFRILPLAIPEDEVRQAEEIASPLSILPYAPLSVGLVTTGRELAEGRIVDSFRPKLEEKLKTCGGSLIDQAIVTDDEELIASAVDAMIDRGAHLVICTGGMSVDADDVTSGAIRSRADEVIFRGLPVLPGCHLMLARRGPVYLIGVPAGAVFEPLTSLDLILPLLFAGITPSFEDTRRWGVGGLMGGDRRGPR